MNLGLQAACLSLLVWSCTSMQAQVYVPEGPKDLFVGEARPDDADYQDYQKGVELLRSAKAAEALELFKNFPKNHPSSQLIFASKLKLAEAHYAIEEWNQGTLVLQRLIQMSVKNEPISARALFLVSYGHEAVGANMNALVSLRDAEKLSQHLDSLSADVVLPARMGLLYMKLNLITESQTQFRRAEVALSRIKARARDGGDPALAEVFYRMAGIHTRDLSMENFQLIIDAMAQSQRYAIQAMEYETKSLWSERARFALQSNYLDLWNFAFRPPAMAGMDPGAAARQQRDLQIRWVGAILSLIDLARTETAIVQVTANGQVAQFIEFLDDMENKAKLVVYRPQDLTPLTEEALNKLRGKTKPLNIRKAVEENKP